MKYSSLYWLLALNFFIALPLILATLNEMWIISFNEIAYFICPIIAIAVILIIIYDGLLSHFHGVINIIGQSIVGLSPLLIALFF